MSTLAPLFDIDDDILDATRTASIPEPVITSVEDALGRTNVLIVGRTAEDDAAILREMAIAEGMNLLTFPSAAERLLAVRKDRRGVSFIPTVLVVLAPTQAVERVAAAGPRYGITVVLAVDEVSEVEGWDSTGWMNFRARAVEVAA